MKMDKHELETLKIDQIFIGSSKDELIALGEKRREKYPISAISSFHPVDWDVVQLIKLTEEKMIPELLYMRHQRMMQNLFSYFRATAGIMERDILAIAHYQSPKAPMIYGYVHKQKELDAGLAQWATAYADQMEKDFQAFGKYLLGDDDDD